MKNYVLPEKDRWSEICARPIFEKNELTDNVQLILSDVKSNKDKALVGLTQAFDGVTLDSLLVSSIEIQDAIKSVS